ncbi:J domain-containing protein [Govanella unica]|uniref:J domain-containing protein n=1 Tax=Govanella unica TaxID=2975056 RepID=A0A9X3TZF7_9PROT|nr:J domain-containing protein [Govania unica]MDA5194560.1 J domain-containing protein [Govania unica]
MSRSRSWGFPRWGGYGGETQAQKTRGCDHAGCTHPGAHPAPKSRSSDEKYWFCQTHAAEYNRSWNYFSGMSYDDMMRAAEAEARTAQSYKQTAAWSFAESGSLWTPEERRALGLLGLEEEASEDEIKSRYRQLAKQFHPDSNPGEAAADAAAKFHVIHQAYALLRRSDVHKRRA